MPAGVHLGLSKIGCLLGACRSSSRIKGGNSAGQVPAARCLLKHKHPSSFLDETSNGANSSKCVLHSYIIQTSFEHMNFQPMMIFDFSFTRLSDLFVLALSLLYLNLMIANLNDT